MIESTGDAVRADSTVEVWADIVCPWCWIGRRHLEAAATDAGRGIRLVGHSYRLNPAASPTEQRSLAEILAEKYRVDRSMAEAMNSEVTRAATQAGLVYRLDRARPGNTLDAHRLLIAAEALGLRNPLEERFFRAYFTEGEPIGDPVALRRLAPEAGVPRELVEAVLDSDRFADDVERDELRARALGARGVPFFRFADGSVLSGAQPVGTFAAALRRASRASTAAQSS